MILLDYVNIPLLIAWQVFITAVFSCVYRDPSYREFLIRLKIRILAMSSVLVVVEFFIRFINNLITIYYQLR